MSEKKEVTIESWTAQMALLAMQYPSLKIDVEVQVNGETVDFIKHDDCEVLEAVELEEGDHPSL